jgi:hypothetical protein
MGGRVNTEAMKELVIDLNLAPGSTLRDIVLGLVVDLPGAYDYVEAYLAEENR